MTMTPEPEKCPDCGRLEWWYRPDGSRICGGCVRAAGTRGEL